MFCTSVYGSQVLSKIVLTILMQLIFLILINSEVICSYWINQLCSFWSPQKNLHDRNTLISENIVTVSSLRSALGAYFILKFEDETFIFEA